MAFKMRSGNSPAFKKVGSSPMKALPVAAALATGARALVKKGVKKIAQNPKVKKAVATNLPAVHDLGKSLRAAASKSKVVSKAKGKYDKLKKAATGLSVAAGVSSLMGSKDKKPATPVKGGTKKINKDLSVNLDTGEVKSKKQTAVRNKIEANRKTKPGEKVKGGTKTWKEGSKASGGNLNKWVAERKKHKKGSAEYNALQNKINKALGSKKRHGQTTTTKTAGPKVSKDTKRTTKTKVATPGLGSKETKVVKGTKDNIRKTKVVDRDVSGDVTKKTKKKYDVDGNRKKMKVTTKTKDTVTKLKVKDRKDEPAKVKTRKRGGTGIGAAIKSKIAERKARRANR
jgi:hypothetical protein